MKILHSIGELAGLKGPIVLAAGTFDGVHLGHQALIRRALQEASACAGTAVVMTFDRHPAALLRPGKTPRILIRNEGKIALLEGMGVPALLMLEFTRDLAGVPARDFITSLTQAAHPLHAICVGSQWSFGNGGEGNVSLLKELGTERDFSVIQIDPVMVDDAPISSTRIRAAISSGNLDETKRCLGRPYLLTGTVVSGAGLGSKIGFPTANLDLEGLQIPPDGVYAVRVHREGEIQQGVCNIGVRPTVDASASLRTVEVHLLGISGNFVGQEFSLEFVKFLRPEQKFSGLKELTEQISADCREAQALSGA